MSEKSVLADPKTQLEPGILGDLWVYCTLISDSAHSDHCSSDIIKQKRSYKQQHALRNSAVLVFLDESTWCFSIMC